MKQFLSFLCLSFFLIGCNSEYNININNAKEALHKGKNDEAINFLNHALIENPDYKKAKLLLDTALANKKLKEGNKLREESLAHLTNLMYKYEVIFNDGYYSRDVNIRIQESLEYGLNRNNKLEVLLNEITEMAVTPELEETKIVLQDIIKLEIEATNAMMIIYLMTKDYNANKDPLNQYGEAIDKWTSSLDKRDELLPKIKSVLNAK